MFIGVVQGPKKYLVYSYDKLPELLMIIIEFFPRSEIAIRSSFVAPNVFSLE